MTVWLKLVFRLTLLWMFAPGSDVVFWVFAQQSWPVRSVLRHWSVDGTWPCSSPIVCADSANRSWTWMWRRWHQL